MTRRGCRQRRQPSNRRGRPRRASRAAIDDDSGSTLPLTALYAALACALILVITAASSLYLERKRLFTVADGAALAGAEAWSFSAAATGTDTPAVEFDEAALRRVVDDYLTAAESAAGFDEFRLIKVESADGRGVAVALAARWRWPGTGGLVPVDVPLEVVATARSIIR
jgi:uncharacterized membrane protein